MPQRLDSVAELRRKAADPFYQQLTEAERHTILMEQCRRYLERTPPEPTDIYSFLPSSRVSRGEMRSWIVKHLGEDAMKRSDFDAPLTLAFRLFILKTCKENGEKYR